MAVTDPGKRSPRTTLQQTDARHRRAVNSTLHALTAAALALPGLAPTASQAADGNEAEFQYGHYEEGPRDTFETNTVHDPIQVDKLYTSAGVKLSERLKLRFKYLQDTWSGATPITTAPVVAMAETESGASSYVQNGYMVNDQLQPVAQDPETEEWVEDSTLIHMVTSASPETRKQADLQLGYEWDERALDFGGGVSQEDDYDSRFLNANLRWDLHQKLTTLNVGASYTDSDIRALRNPLHNDYIDYSAHDDPSDPDRVLGSRHDWSAFFGISQVIDKNSVLEAGLSYTQSKGFLENAYKPAIFAFIDPDQMPEPDGRLSAMTYGVLEDRPDERDQWTWSLRYVRYFAAPDAALHLDYRLFHDSWGIDAHTVEAAWAQPLGDGWTLTPRLRYYTQDQADFYQPYYVFNQALPLDPDTNKLDLDQVPIEDFSSDYRLSGYGALGTGLTLSKELGNGAATIEAGIEYYRHAAALAASGGDDGDYSDFNYLLLNLGLRIDLSAPSSLGANAIAAPADSGHEHHSAGAHGDHTAHRAPAGVMADHMLPNAGDVMIGYRYLYSRQAGDTLRGTDSVSDEVIVNNGCGDVACSLTPSEMTMHMHMLDIMYAVNDRFNIMIMPQLMDMDMKSRMIGEDAGSGDHADHASHDHATGGIGDTGLTALIKLYEMQGHHFNIGLGLNVPTGSVEEKTIVQSHDADGEDHASHTREEFVHYHMQLGSGTWDFRPTLTYTGYKARWAWGAQIGGTYRLQDANDSGYALGNIFQATAWGSYGLNEWLSASLRGAYMAQSAISGEYNDAHAESSPADWPYNYGGRFSDVGVGLSAAATRGDLKGNTLSIEWLEPVMDHAYGYQLERKGTLYASWTLAF